MNPVLLTLITTPSVEQKLLDWLLTHDHPGFTTFACDGHGARPERLSTAEQVAGRQDCIAFWIQLSADRAHELVAGLGSDFADAGLHYWISPLLEAGRISASGAPAQEGR